MIWYRHWLELRVPVLVASLGAVVSAWRYAGAIVDGLSRLEAGTAPVVFRSFEALVPAMGPDGVLVWGTHAAYSFTLAMLVPFVMAGTAIGGPFFISGRFAPSWREAPFTLSLPVSRFRLIWTRLAVAGLATLLVFAIYLFAHAAVLFSIGQVVPWGPMVAVSFAAATLSMAWTALVTLMQLFHPIVYPAFVIPILLTTLIGRAVGPGLADGGVSPGLIVFAAVVVTAALSLLTVLARRTEI
jgi:hypothetical protein